MNKLQEELEILKLHGAGIAHDLGNVLTVIVGNLELARLLHPKSELWQTFHELEEAVNMAKALHGQLHQLFQRRDSVMERVKLDELLEEATRPGLFGSGMAWRFKLSPNLPLIQHNTCQISQVIESLVLNAVQAISERLVLGGVSKT